MNLVPGTVSKILWHFTGGPNWDKSNNCQFSEPKPSSAAWEAFISILKSKELRLGNYKEVVKVLVPQYNEWDREAKKMVKKFNEVISITSQPVCCLADIPLMHLNYHAKRYGKFAIGFHRDSVVRHGFNPVFYALQDSQALMNMYAIQVYLDELDSLDFDVETSSLESNIESLTCEEDHEVSVDASSLINDLENLAREKNLYVDQALKSLETHMSFVKTFDHSEFDSIYTEREWRSIVPFSFKYSDIAMVVVPGDDPAGDFVGNMHGYATHVLQGLTKPSDRSYNLD